MRTILQFSLTCIAVCLFVTAEATVWTVSNDANRPAQFTGIQAAIDSVDPGDTILITGGSYFGTLNLLKPVVMIGEGIGTTTPKTIIGSSTSSTINIKRLNSSLSASGSKFFGIQFNGRTTIDGNFIGATAGQETIEDLLFERCFFTYDLHFTESSGGYSNNTFRNCAFAAGNQDISISDVEAFGNLWTNCVFSNQFFTTANKNVNGGVIIRNSIFMNRTSNSFSTAVGLLIENTIFYKSEPGGASSSTYNNCLSYLNNDNTLPPGTNLGGGNIVNADPEFVNYPPLGAAFSFAHNYDLQGTSPAIGTGTNGTNIGLTGGNAPVNNIPQEPKIPIVTEVNIPVSSVPVGGILQINIKANTRN